MQLNKMRKELMEISTGNPDGILITLGEVAMEHPPIKTEFNDAFILQALGEVTPYYMSRTRVDHVDLEDLRFPGDRRVITPTSLMIQAAHEAYSAHVGLTFSPEIAWYMIVHEVAICVKKNPYKYAYLFTDNPREKQILRVHDNTLVHGSSANEWEKTIELFRQKLQEKLTPNTADMFLPPLSTLTAESSIALLLALMDTASSYYDYRVMTMCGIPAVRVTGTTQDWSRVLYGATQLGYEISELLPYFEAVLEVLEIISNTVAGNSLDQEAEHDFWCSVYKLKRRSGGELISGWISAFTAYLQTPKGFEMKDNFDWKKIHGSYNGWATDSFPSHISKIPLIWEYMGRPINMIFSAGIYGIEYQNDCLTPKLGFGIFETNSRD